MLQKFKSSLKQESLIYFLMFLVLTLLMHSDMLSTPLVRIDMMDKENYTHPFLYTLFIYTLFFIIRKILDFIISFFEKK
jgi:hypothetical protein